MEGEIDCSLLRRERKRASILTMSASSELHMFRGIEPAGTDFIMGHEFVGEIVELGSAVKNLQKGDRVVTAFTTSW